MSHFASSGHIHLENGLEGFGLDGEYYSIPPHISFGLIADEDISGELIDWIFADDGEGYFIFIGD